MPYKTDKKSAKKSAQMVARSKGKWLNMLHLAQIAQSVEQGIENPRVGGSIPPLGTIFLKMVTVFEASLIAGLFYALRFAPKTRHWWH
jgi:hypothetical protein